MKDNKLIAEFMEVDGFLSLSQMNYHTSWDWLMPVVEKIESLRDANGDSYRFTIDMCNAQIEGTHIEMIGGAYKLNTTYKAVVKFIQYYQKKNVIAGVDFSDSINQLNKLKL